MCVVLTSVSNDLKKLASIGRSTVKLQGDICQKPAMLDRSGALSS